MAAWGSPDLGALEKEGEEGHEAEERKAMILRFWFGCWIVVALLLAWAYF